MTTCIPIFSLDWHVTQSPALRELVSEPLGSYIQFEQIGWDGENFPGIQTKSLKGPIIFFQLPPPPHFMAEYPNAHIIWIPMWDMARVYDLKWWHNLPKNLRVIAFSQEVSARAQAVGLNTLDLRFFRSPDEFTSANWSKNRVLFYWNRTGLVGEHFLSLLCQSLDVELLIYLHRIDPRISVDLDYSLPKKLGETRVQEIESNNFLAKQEYIRIVNQANIFIAPRISEGVGLFFIEALARGCAVFAYDAPTMNEYINHKINGYLFKKYADTSWNYFRDSIRQKGHWLRHPNNQPPLERPVTDWQNWKEIRRLNLQMIGENARQAQARGFQEWINFIPRYASFIIDW